MRNPIRRLARRILGGPVHPKYVIGLNEVVHHRNGHPMRFHTSTVARECFLREVAMSDFDGYLALYKWTEDGPQVMMDYRTDTRAGSIRVY